MAVVFVFNSTFLTPREEIAHKIKNKIIRKAMVVLNDPKFEGNPDSESTGKKFNFAKALDNPGIWVFGFGEIKLINLPP